MTILSEQEEKYLKYKTLNKMKITEEKLSSIENQIEQEQKAVSYDIREFTIEYYVNKYLNGEETDDNELYVPEYQREFIWDDKRQSRFIESLFLGLPVPLVFVAEIEEDGRLEIVDGSQRIRTLAAYLNDELTLRGLDKLSELNQTVFSQLQSSRQRKFKNISMRMIVLSTKATEDIRNEMFDRINTSSVPLLPMEVRRGIYRGKFTDFITELSQSPLMKKLCPLTTNFRDRREEEELILRFFAFKDALPYNFKLYEKNIDGGVARFLDNYLRYKNDNIDEDELDLKREQFSQMLKFVDTTFPNQGFAKKKGAKGVSKPYFEAIAIGSFLALQENPNLYVQDISWATIDKENINRFFKILSGRYNTHTPQKIKERVEYVKDNLLKSNRYVIRPRRIPI